MFSIKNKHLDINMLDKNYDGTWDQTASILQ